LETFGQPACVFDPGDDLRRRRAMSQRAAAHTANREIAPQLTTARVVSAAGRRASPTTLARAKIVNTWADRWDSYQRYHSRKRISADLRARAVTLSGLTHVTRKATDPVIWGRSRPERRRLGGSLKPEDHAGE
jgi:hypothetical protein